MSTDDDNGLTRLPNGFLTEDGDWIRYMRMREMTGVEEDMLSDRQHKRDGKVAEKIFGNCITHFYTEVEGTPVAFEVEPRGLLPELLMSDMTFSMVRLRQLSLGDSFDFQANCPVCKDKGDYTVDLSKQEVTYREDPPLRAYPVILPSGDTAELVLLNLKQNAKMVRYKRQSPDKVLTYQVYLTTRLFNGKPLASPEEVREWSTKLRNDVRAAADKEEFGIDVMVGNDCNCGAYFEVALPMGDEGFFFPSGLRKR